MIMRLFKEMLILGVGFFAAIYLLNPGAGLIEFITDLAPVIGNMDEAAATGIILSVLAHYGLDLTAIFGRPQRRKSPPITNRRQPDIIVQEAPRPAEKDKR